MSKLTDGFAETLTQPINVAIINLVGAYTVIWGFWLANPFLNTFEGTPLYAALAAAVPCEVFWGLVAIIAGALTLHGSIKHYPVTTFYGAGIAAIHWFVISLFYFAGDVTNTGGITAAFICILCVLIYLSCKVNYDNEHDCNGFKQ